jgi:hypothetical protein
MTAHNTLADIARIFSWPTPPKPSNNPLHQWQMERDDAPIFSYLYRQHMPVRHLEFGTWQGFGTCLCLDNCPATVWTLNLPDGESKADGSWAYGHRVDAAEVAPLGAVVEDYGSDAEGRVVYHRTDASSYIGRFYRERGLGRRVCQIYCDSREWDTNAYTPDFFDSVLVDGGHQADVVISDTSKALSVLRSGGMVLWHDFCPEPLIRERFDSVRGVVSGIEAILPELNRHMQLLTWINPSWILLGIKK